jgi:hypothetical protein
MDEQTIAQRLQQTLHAPDDSVAAPPATDEPSEYDDSAGDYGEALGMYKLYDLFEIDPRERSADTEAKLRSIWQWASNISGQKDYLSVATVIRQYEQALGAGSVTHSRLDRLHQYIKLDGQIARLKQEQELLYGF